LESILLSAPLSYLKTAKEIGNKGAIRMTKLKQDIDKPLSAILSINTIAHTVGAAGVGSQSIQLWGDAYFGLVSAVMTILILFLTEIIPKTIGARYWKESIGFASRTIQGLIIITYPIVIVSAYITNFLSNDKSDPSTSREEISALATIGTQEGVLGEKENKILQNLMRLKNSRIATIMTPRTVVSMADENTRLDAFLQEKNYLLFSRIPVCTNKGENVSGYVFRQTVFEKLAEDKTELQLKDIKREIVVVPETMPILSVWEILSEKKEHIALIVNEYGEMDGIVTMEDIIETLLGIEIIDEKDTIADMQQYARERWESKQKTYLGE
jgi:CBS domain containing-hemolysin-like protein